MIICQQSVMLRIPPTVLRLNLSSSLLCRFCKHSVSLIEVKRQGLGSRLAFHCSNEHCNKQIYFPNCSLIQVNNLTNSSISCRSVFAMHCIGDDRAELRAFCGVMDLPPPVCNSIYNCIKKNTIETAAS